MKRDTGDILANCGKQLVENKKKRQIQEKYSINDNVYQINEGQKTVACGVASIICGGIGIFFWLMGIVGLILGIVAVKNPNERKGTAIVGVVISTFAPAWPILAYICMVLLS